METTQNNTSEAGGQAIVSVLTDDANLVNIRTFVVAARFLSFKDAARFLCLTPGAVSHRIANLEDALGFPLFNRLTRGIALTREGERLVHICMGAFMRFRDEIHTRVGQENFSSLTLYSHQSVAVAWLIPRLAQFHARHSSAHIHLQTGNALMSFEPNSQVDMALYYANNTFTGLHSEKFMAEEMFPVCSPDYAHRHQLCDNPENLKKCTLLHDAAAWHFSSPTAEWQEWFQENALDTISGQSAVAFDTSYAASVAASHHLGIAMGRRKIVQSMLAENRLINPFPSIPAVKSDFGYYAVWPRSLHVPSKLKIFLAWLHEAGAAS